MRSVRDLPFRPRVNPACSSLKPAEAGLRTEHGAFIILPAAGRPCGDRRVLPRSVLTGCYAKTFGKRRLCRDLQN
jgi:hypothetical protein